MQAFIRLSQCLRIMSHLSIQTTQSLHETYLKIYLFLCCTDPVIKERSETPLFKTQFVSR